eukprot:16450224-Heterocapsa_arctica.AAC.1
MASTSHPHQDSAHATGAYGGPSGAAVGGFPVPGCSSARAGVSYHFLWSLAEWKAPQTRPEALTMLHLWAREHVVDLHLPELYKRQSSVPSLRAPAPLVQSVAALSLTVL